MPDGHEFLTQLRSASPRCAGRDRLSASELEALAELHRFEEGVLPPALCEAIRLLESDKFDHLTDADILAVANYRAIELEEELFFERAFTPGKEAAASLGFARLLGRDVVLDDLRRLRAALGCQCHRESAVAAPAA